MFAELLFYTVFHYCHFSIATIVPSVIHAKRYNRYSIYFSGILNLFYRHHPYYILNKKASSHSSSLLESYQLFTYFRPGGVHSDIFMGLLSDIYIEQFNIKILEIEEMLNENRIWKQRLVDIGQP
jgi:hypothetical protein